jgi:hypothetical protein
MIIHKQVLMLAEYQRVLVPEGAKILKVADQNGLLVFWYSFESQLTDKKQLEFQIVGTGNFTTLHKDMQYLDSVITGAFVWHVYVREV